MILMMSRSASSESSGYHSRAASATQPKTGVQYLDFFSFGDNHHYENENHNGLVYDHHFLVMSMVTTMIISCERFNQVSTKQKHIQSNKQGGRISGSYHRYRYFHQHHHDHYHYHHSPYHYQYDHYHYDDRSGMEEEKELPAWATITILFIRFQIRFQQKLFAQIL